MKTRLSRRFSMVSSAFILAIVLASTSSLAAGKTTYAYVNYTDSIAQYKVLPDGKFVPLNPARVTIDEPISNSLLLHPTGRFAYCG